MAEEIVELDFGCEGRQDGTVVKDQVLIRLADRTKITLEMEDKLLYETGIDEGSSFLIESKGAATL